MSTVFFSPYTGVSEPVWALQASCAKNRLQYSFKTRDASSGHQTNTVPNVRVTKICPQNTMNAATGTAKPWPVPAYYSPFACMFPCSPVLVMRLNSHSLVNSWCSISSWLISFSQTDVNTSLAETVPSVCTRKNSSGTLGWPTMSRSA